MISGSDRYKLNEPKVVSETLDGEAIAINLVTGSYYSMNASGSAIWGLILAGNSVVRIIDQAKLRYVGESQAIGKSIESFIVRLMQVDLIIESELTEPGILPSWDQPKEAFLAPSIEEYDDMQEMLLADPVHDVTEAGWPNRK
jgi:hypothetical protein